MKVGDTKVTLHFDTASASGAVKRLDEMLKARGVEFDDDQRAVLLEWLGALLSSGIGKNEP